MKASLNLVLDNFQLESYKELNTRKDVSDLS